MTLAIILFYLFLVLMVGAASHRLFKGTGEDYFLATRSIGGFVLLMSLFGTHMTAFTLLGASGEAYRLGIGVFGLMASSSALVVPLVIYGVGMRLWDLGRRHRYLTQADFFSDRFESPRLGLALFVVLTLLLVPYLLIGVMGGGLALNQITDGSVPQWAGSLLITAVVMAYVTFGGLRGTAWANTFQTLVFMILGGLAFVVITRRLGGLGVALDRVEALAPDLMIRGPGIPPLKFLSFMLIPLSVGMFPHIFMHWLTARSRESFRPTLIFYPLCVAVVWLPSVLLGVMGVAAVPGLQGPAANSVMVRMIHDHAPGVLAGLLAAGVFAAVMSSLDSQVLALGTMFTRDVVRKLGAGARLTDAGQVLAGRLFVAGILALAWVISLVASPSIFGLGIWSFSGYAALFPLVVAALYWRRTTRAGAWAALLSATALWIGLFTSGVNAPGASVGGTGLMPVAVITAGSALALVLVSLLTAPPDARRLQRFFQRTPA